MMLELTVEQSKALERTVVEQLCAHVPENNAIAPLYEQVVRAAVLATIATIKEYERMKAPR